MKNFIFQPLTAYEHKTEKMLNFTYKILIKDQIKRLHGNFLEKKKFTPAERHFLDVIWRLQKLD